MGNPYLEYLFTSGSGLEVWTSWTNTMRKIYIYLIDQCRIENKINITHNRTWFYENGNQKHSGWEAKYQVSKQMYLFFHCLFFQNSDQKWKWGWKVSFVFLKVKFKGFWLGRNVKWLIKYWDHTVYISKSEFRLMCYLRLSWAGN